MTTPYIPTAGEHKRDSHGFPDDPSPAPTDLLGLARRYAKRCGLSPDITTWSDEEIAGVLEWWAKRCAGRE